MFVNVFITHVQKQGKWGEGWRKDLTSFHEATCTISACLQLTQPLLCHKDNLVISELLLFFGWKNKSFQESNRIKFIYINIVCIYVYINYIGKYLKGSLVNLFSTNE